LVARSRPGKANQVDASGATHSLQHPAAAPGAATDAPATTNATTFGVLHERQPNVVPNIFVNTAAAAPSVAIVRSTTALRAKALVMARAVIITCAPTTTVLAG